jgi:2-polyprenyl-3-methyl-5-hydroxy-6-metoxy-1,4-benzoquinol methylase
LPLVRGKFDRILALAEGKDVLDIGCLGGETHVDVSRTAHGMLATRARSCLGIDIDSSEIRRWQGLGYDVLLADAENFHINRTFDLIVAADLIEHLGNPGQFLERAKAHLRPRGLLCIVTPNAHSLNSAFKSLAGLTLQVNPEHTCWYDRTTLRQLLSRYGFGPIEEYWQDYQRHPLAALALRARKNLAAHIIVIAHTIEGGSLA